MKMARKRFSVTSQFGSFFFSEPYLYTEKLNIFCINNVVNKKKKKTAILRTNRNLHPFYESIKNIIT